MRKQSRAQLSFMTGILGALSGESRPFPAGSSFFDERPALWVREKAMLPAWMQLFHPLHTIDEDWGKQIRRAIRGSGSSRKVVSDFSRSIVRKRDRERIAKATRFRLATRRRLKPLTTNLPGRSQHLRAASGNR